MSENSIDRPESQVEKAFSNWEIKRLDDSTLFRDGEGLLYKIDNEAVATSPKRHFDNWLVGSMGSESPNTPFTDMRQREVEGYSEEDEGDDGDNLVAGGGLYYPVQGWREKLAENSSHYAPELITAIEESIKRGIARFKESKDIHYPAKVFDEMMERIEE